MLKVSQQTADRICENPTQFSVHFQIPVYYNLLSQMYVLAKTLGKSYWIVTFAIVFTMNQDICHQISFPCITLHHYLETKSVEKNRLLVIVLTSHNHNSHIFQCTATKQRFSNSLEQANKLHDVTKPFFTKKKCLKIVRFFILKYARIYHCN